MASKRKPAESANPSELPSIAAMKFWDRLKNRPPVLAFAFPEDPDFERESLGPLLRLPAVPADDSAVFSLQISLDPLSHLNLSIWRRIQVKSISLESLHQIIQLCFGWEDMHLHGFNVLKTRVPLREEGAAVDERTMTLAQLHAAKVKKFHYTYDFGDDWRHTIKIEKKLEAQPLTMYPQCIDGDGANPVEDCGGIDRWSQFLVALEHPEQQPQSVLMELRERFGNQFVPRPFDLEATNQNLTKAFQKRSRGKRPS